MNSRKLLIKLIFIFLIITSCSDQSSEDLDEEKGINKVFSSQSIYDQLLEAYNDSCVDCLKQILLDWENRYSPDLNIPDSLQDVYDVYKEFYSPWDLARISDSEFGHDIYKGISFYIIQDSITYDYNFRTFGNNFYTIKNFRPEIKNSNIHLLYLDSTYAEAINSFLGADYTPMGTGSVMTPALPAGETAKRYTFLSNFLYFFHGHWGNYWHIETHPQVSGISFNETKDSAQVYFRLGYQGGEAILGKNNDEWKITDHYMTWIE